ncbi:MAG: hypothetical protein QG608_2356, partial [Actinomycetota bacterium]|nr:hypothetical protein [Actinomycetota bacterium]
ASYRCVLSGHTDWVNAVAFSPDGSLLATGSDDGTARLWDLTGEKPPTILSGHTDRVLGVAFSPDGSLLASASDDGTTRLWNSHAGTLLATLLALPDNGYAALFPDGSYKLRGDPGQALWWAVKVRRFPPGELDQYVDGVHRLPETLPIISPVRPVEGPE